MQTTTVSPARQSARLILDAGVGRNEGLRTIERELIIECLERNRGNICHTARELQVHRNTLSRSLQELRLVDLPNKIRAQIRQPQLSFMRKPSGRWPGANRERKIA